MRTRFGLFSFCWMALSVTGGFILASPAQAYTPDQEQLCTGDAFRLCGSAIPDVERVTACMIRQRAQLSPGCAQFFRDPEPVPVATQVRARKPLSVKPRKVRKRPVN